MTKIYYATDPKTLSNFLEQFENYGVCETEYGTVEVEGSCPEWTLNHHLDPSKPCPCIVKNLSRVPPVIGVSHFDLDTLGGVLALQGRKPDAPEFWELAAFVDTNGPHRVAQFGASDETVAQIMAFWVWSQENRLQMAPKGEVVDVTSHFAEAERALLRILNNDPKMLDAGVEFKHKNDVLRDTTWVDEVKHPRFGWVVLRTGPAFLNALYYRKDGSPADVVIGHRTDFGSITISHDKVDGLNCATVAQEFFGPDAGGHPGIAGTPRNSKYNLSDAKEFFEFFIGYGK
jgi:hypothetical protein